VLRSTVFRGNCVLKTLKTLLETFKATQRSFKIAHKNIITTPHLLTPVGWLTNIVRL
jgi:hypothetical protein